MALIFLCSGCCNASTDKFTLSAATTTVDTTTVHTPGGSSWRTNITGTGSYVQHFFAAATQELTFRGYLRFTSLPNAAGDRTIWQANSAAGGHATIQVTSAGLIKVLFSGGTAQNHPTTVTTGVWYRVDVKVDVDDGTGTAKLNVQIDGVAATQATIVQTATTITYCRWGAPAASTTMDLYWADVRIDNTIAVYPIGVGYIKPLVPTATGTHSFTTGDFQDSSSTNIATSNTDSWAVIDDMPLGGAAVGDYWKQVVVRTTGYLEYTLTQISGYDNPKGVSLSWAMASSAAALASMDARLNDGGTISAASHYYSSVTTVKHGTRNFDTRPNGGTEWTLAAINALRVRGGYSDDLTAYMAGILVEAEFTTVGATHDGAASVNGAATVTGAGTRVLEGAGTGTGVATVTAGAGSVNVDWESGFEVGDSSAYSLGGPAALDTVTFHGGARSIKIPAVGGTTYVQRLHDVARPVSVAQWYQLWDTFPNANHNFALPVVTAGTACQFMVTSAGVVTFKWAGGSTITHPTSLVTGRWYRFDALTVLDDGTGTKKLNLAIDGVFGTQTDLVEAATTSTAFRMGSPAGTVTTTSYVDDVKHTDNAAAWPILSQQAASSLSASATVTGAATVSHGAAASVSALATTAAAATIQHSALASVTGLASTTSAGSIYTSGAASLSALASTTSAATIQHGATSSLIGAASVAAPGAIITSGAASITGFATLAGAASGYVSADASITGLATTTVAGGVYHSASSSLTANATITGAGRMTHGAAALLIGEAQVTTEAITDRYGAASITALATTAVAGAITMSAAATVSGVCNTAAAGTRVLSSNATITGLATLAGAGARTYAAAASIAALASVSADAGAYIEGAATISGSAVVSGVPGKYLPGASSVASAATVAGAGLLTHGAVAALAGSAVVEGVGAMTLSAAALIQALATVSVQGNLVLEGAASIEGTASVSATIGLARPGHVMVRDRMPAGITISASGGSF